MPATRKTPGPRSGAHGRRGHPAAVQANPTPVVFSLDPTGPPHPRTRTTDPDTADPPRTRIRTQWTARLATPADAELLQVPIGTVVLHIVRTIADTDGTLKATTTLCPGDRTILHHSYPISPTT